MNGYESEISALDSSKLPSPTPKAKPKLVCPKCASTSVHSSRRKTSYEQWSALWGLAYYRCSACRHRWHQKEGVAGSRSFRKGARLLSRRLIPLILIAIVLALLLKALFWMQNRATVED